MTIVKIILAEDEPQIARLVHFKLVREGFDVIWEDNGLKVWEAVQTEKPDLVLLDVMMPIMSGFEVLEKIRSDSALKDIPVIMFTAKSRGQDIKRAKKLGANHYITKPFDISDLVIQIRKVLQSDMESYI